MHPHERPTFPYINYGQDDNVNGELIMLGSGINPDGSYNHGEVVGAFIMMGVISESDDKDERIDKFNSSRHRFMYCIKLPSRDLVGVIHEYPDNGEEWSEIYDRVHRIQEDMVFLNFGPGCTINSGISIGYSWDLRPPYYPRERLSPTITWDDIIAAKGFIPHSGSNYEEIDDVDLSIQERDDFELWDRDDDSNNLLKLLDEELESYND